MWIGLGSGMRSSRIEGAQAMRHRPRASRWCSIPVASHAAIQDYTISTATPLDQYIQAALDACHGKVFGPGGAADLLDLKPTTLASRMKALGIAGARGRVGA